MTLLANYSFSITLLLTTKTKPISVPSRPVDVFEHGSGQKRTPNQSQYVHNFMVCTGLAHEHPTVKLYALKNQKILHTSLVCHFLRLFEYFCFRQIKTWFYQEVCSGRLAFKFGDHQLSLRDDKLLRLSQGNMRDFRFHFFRQDHHRWNLNTRKCCRITRIEQKILSTFSQKRGHLRFSNAVKVQNVFGSPSGDFPSHDVWCEIDLSRSGAYHWNWILQFPGHFTHFRSFLGWKPLSPFEIGILLQIKSLLIAVCEGPLEWRTSKTRSDFSCFCFTSALKTAISRREGARWSKHGWNYRRCRTIRGLGRLEQAVTEQEERKYEGSRNED